MTQPNKKTAKHPALRFPEFQESWAVKKLGHIGAFLGGGTPSKSIQEYWHGNIPWVSSSDILEDDISTISITRYINKKAINESATKLVPKGSIIFVSRVGTGKLAVNQVELCTSQDFTNFIPEEGYSYYIAYFFLSNKLSLTSMGQGTSIKGFSKNDLANFPLHFPINQSEQKKIADCLSALDEIITAENEKLSALKTHKKGLMQQLFPQAGDTTPRLRFPEFRGGKDWEEKKLGDVADIISGQSPKGDSYNNTNIGMPFFQGKTDFGDIFLNKPSKWTTEITKEAIPGDILMSVRAPVGALNISNLKICIGRGLASIRAKNNKWFLYYYLFKNRINIIGNGGSIFDSINKKQIENLLILIPPLPEQQRIADCLSSLDDLITAQSTKIQHLKTHKKGMMQNLFPKID